MTRVENPSREEIKKILETSGLAIQAADNMGDGAQKIVQAVKNA